MLKLKKVDKNEVQVLKNYIVRHNNKIDYYCAGKLQGKMVLTKNGSLFGIDNNMEIYEIENVNDSLPA